MARKKKSRRKKEIVEITVSIPGMLNCNLALENESKRFIRKLLRMRLALILTGVITSAWKAIKWLNQSS